MNEYSFGALVFLAFAALPALLIWHIFRLTKKSEVKQTHSPQEHGDHDANQPQPGTISSRLRKFMASLQLLGGSVLLLSIAHEFSSTPPQDHNLLSICFYIIFILFCSAAIAYGWLLRKGVESSRLPSAAIWFVQLPFVISSPISYSIVLGLAAQLQVIETPRGTAFNVNFPLFEQHIFYVAGQTPSFAIGINLLAAYFCYRLFTGSILVFQRSDAAVKIS